jgi:hypothetical protein
MQLFDSAQASHPVATAARLTVPDQVRVVFIRAAFAGFAVLGLFTAPVAAIAIAAVLLMSLPTARAQAELSHDA